MSQMYPWVHRSYNPLAGLCCHACSYCYRDDVMGTYPACMTKYSGPVRIDEPAMLTGPPRSVDGKYVFVGSMTDVFANDVPSEFIERILARCCKAPDRNYLFQSKNPGRFAEFAKQYPPRSLFATTIESNNDFKVSRAPPPKERYEVMCTLELGPKMVSIEPVMDCDVYTFAEWIRDIAPKFVSVGADSKNSNLIEPGADDLSCLLRSLCTITEVREKPNLSRLLARKIS